MSSKFITWLFRYCVIIYGAMYFPLNRYFSIQKLMRRPAREMNGTTGIRGIKKTVSQKVLKIAAYLNSISMGGH